MLRKVLTAFAGLALAAGLVAATTGTAGATIADVKCVETTTVTAAPVSPQTIDAGKTVNVLFTAASSTTWTLPDGTTVTKDTTGKYVFAAVNQDGLVASPASAADTTATFALPVGTFKVAAAHAKAKVPFQVKPDRREFGCTADGSTVFVVKATPEPTKTVQVPGPTKTVQVPGPTRTVVKTVTETVTGQPAFTG